MTKTKKEETTEEFINKIHYLNNLSDDELMDRIEHKSIKIIRGIAVYSALLGLILMIIARALK